MEHSTTQAIFTIADRGNLQSWANIRGFTSYEGFIWLAGPTWIPGWIARFEFVVGNSRDRFFPVYSQIDADRSYNAFAVSHPTNLTRYNLFRSAAASRGIVIPAVSHNGPNIYAFVRRIISRNLRRCLA
jgi:hypothetical protein